ncbi:hybrid sensor histidine kinase/response regulator [Chondromyces crocatus]|uniref:histidine kinase n=1 Tax=Chondromyces crocatus TaxID=52 RepID=A0A0K1ESQ6_CHOCO|nr:response regulator [Chondromyces crocatus]AKT43672.1 histidine kinase [Chondromyces crocatus]
MALTSQLERAFRSEALELLEGLAQGVLELERDPERIEIVHRCLRQAHTLKGAARIAQRPRVAELAHAIEDAFTPYRAGEKAPEQALMSDLLALVGALRREVTGQTQTNPSTAPGPLAEERLETVRVDIMALDATLEAATETSVQLGTARRAAETVRGAQRSLSLLRRDMRALRALGEAPGSREAGALRLQSMSAKLEELQRVLGTAMEDLGSGLQRMDQELGEVQRRLGILRLVPARTIMPSLELGVRDAAGARGMQVSFVASGEEVRLEGHILAAVRDALLHLVRNAVAHGLESPEERVRLKKPAGGRVRLSVERRGRRAVFSCSDDGRGMDADAIRAAAVAGGAISEEDALALGHDDALRLAIRAGISTSQGVTELSGRGVGLDVAAETAARFDGELRIASEPDVGTTIELEVALSLSSLTALVVLADDRQTLIPLAGVTGVVRLADADVVRDGAGEHILHEGRAIPFMPLARMLDASAVTPRERWSSVILQASGSLVAVGVDRLLGSLDVIVKPLPVAAGEHALVAGAALDAQGNPVLVLDTRGLAQAVENRPATLTPRVVKPRPPVLIIDDSLTTRMLEQGILQGAGFEVDLAGSGEEGLKKAKERRYGLFLVDIEMPGMSGLDFLRITRNDTALRDIPVIIVTSLASVEDRQRGLDAGAAAYIVKGEFDQRRFVTTVRELMEKQA